MNHVNAKDEMFVLSRVSDKTQNEMIWILEGIRSYEVHV